MVHRILTVSRQFGSGGRTIGRTAAEKLGIPCYDHEILDHLAEQSGFSKEYIAHQGEYTAHASWFANAMNNGSNRFGYPSNQDQIWALQKKLILEIAEKEDCVIVGRCADVILEGKADLLKVFIHASFEKRAERIVTVYGETEEPTEKRLKNKDKRRAAYYQYYTDHPWGEAMHYDIALDSGTIGIDKCVEILVDLF